MLPRRAVLGAIGSAVLAGAVPGRAAADPQPRFPDGVTLLVAGPEDGRLDRWAAALAAALPQVLPEAGAVRQQNSGGADGVTGANQFDARATPDGGTALILPGAAATAWLVGDPRAQFAIGHWLPMLAGLAPVVIAGRPELAGFARGTRLRLAASGPTGPELPALLGLDLLDLDVMPVFGLDAAAARAAYAEGAVDAIVLRGPEPVETGAVPLLSMGSVDETGSLGRDPARPDLPALPDLYATRHVADPLYAAWAAVATAGALDAALVLPHLTPTTLVALWRHAASQAVVLAPLRDAASGLSARLVAGPEAAAAVAPLAADVPVQLELRRWLASRYKWHPA